MRVTIGAEYMQYVRQVNRKTLYFHKIMIAVLYYHILDTSASIMKNTRVLLKSRPSGWVTEDNFEIDQSEVANPGEGQILVRNICMSVDPYMRGRMNEAKSYIPPFQLGETLQAGVVGQVIASSNDQYKEGQYVSGMLGWEEYSLSDGAGLQLIDPDIAPSPIILVFSACPA